MVLYDGNFDDKRNIPNKKFLFKDYTCISKFLSNLLQCNLLFFIGTRCESPASLLPVNSQYFIERDSQLFLTKFTLNVYCQGAVEPFSLMCQENDRWNRTDRLVCSKSIVTKKTSTCHYSLNFLAHCGPIFPLSSTRIVNWKASYDVNDVVSFSCDPSRRYHMLGPSSSICLPNGTWSSQPPRCVCKMFVFILSIRFYLKNFSVTMR